MVLLLALLCLARVLLGGLIFSFLRPAVDFVGAAFPTIALVSVLFEATSSRFPAPLALLSRTFGCLCLVVSSVATPAVVAVLLRFAAGFSVAGLAMAGGTLVEVSATPGLLVVIVLGIHRCLGFQEAFQICHWGVFVYFHVLAFFLSELCRLSCLHSLSASSCVGAASKPPVAADSTR